ncbi:MAG: glycoside hydrolase family 2 TIM barrel-domain containing protein [Chloroflexota bacterium]
MWSTVNPVLYNLTARLYQFRNGERVEIDELTVRFGFRHIEFKDDGFYLNGERIQLRGLNRHQTYPYIGAAAPPRLQAQDADIIKYELGCNIVRTSHYPQSPHFLRRCDEIGLLVFEEIPGWQHIGDEDWQAISLRDVQSMIERDRNHPSIIMWGVRINESWDNDDFYRKTNALAHELDPTRPTTGVRFFQDSSILEDVFGFNDFSNGVEEPLHTPHLITEFNGHMFPTKTFDGEERKMEHARRHAHVQNLAYGNPKVSGAIGWCAFDYNTHKEFGSGDRICYHGVMDIFRLPKWAAYVYASQQDPGQRVVLQAATHWTMGDRAEGGNDPIHVYSNVEEIDVYFGDEHLGRFLPDKETYPHLPHPPFTVTGLQMMMMWGQAFGALRIVGKINGEQVAEQQISSDGVPEQLIMKADFPELKADGADMTRITVRITDEFGNTLPYAQNAVMFEMKFEPSDAGARDAMPLPLRDPQLIGENPLVLPGGQGGVYLRAGHAPGTVTITAKSGRFEPQTVTITLV